MSLYMTEDGLPKLHKTVSGNGAASPMKDQPASRDYPFPAFKFNEVLSCFERSAMELEGNHQVPSRQRLTHRAENQEVSGSQSRQTKQNTTFTVYRAGNSENGPSFPPSKNGEVWLVTNPALYYPLVKNETVCLWEADIQKTSYIFPEEHLEYEGVCVVKLNKNVKSAYQLLHIQENLKALDWIPSQVPLSEEGGMSVISFSTLAQAVLDYIKDNPPSSPEEFNSQAELKAVSHWRWLRKTVPKFKPGPHNDFRIVEAATKSLRKWINDEKKIEEQLSVKRFSPTTVRKYESDLEVLKEDIFNLTMYDNKYRKELNAVENNTSTVSSPAEETSFQKKTRVNGDRRPVPVHRGTYGRETTPIPRDMRYMKTSGNSQK